MGTNSVSFLMVVRVRSHFAPFLRIWGPVSQKKKFKDQNLIYLKVQRPVEPLTLTEYS